MKRSLAAAAFAVLLLMLAGLVADLHAARRLEAEHRLAVRSALDAEAHRVSTRSRAPQVLFAALQEPPQDAPPPNVVPPPATEPPTLPTAPDIAEPTGVLSAPEPAAAPVDSSVVLPSESPQPLPTPEPAAAPDAPPARRPSEAPQPAMDPASPENLEAVPPAPPRPSTRTRRGPATTEIPSPADLDASPALALPRTRSRSLAPPLSSTPAARTAPRTLQSPFEMDAELSSTSRLVTPSPATPEVASGPAQFLTLPEGLRYVGKGVFEHQSEAGSIQFRPVANNPGPDGRVVQLPDGATYKGPWPPPIPDALPRINQARDSFFDPLKGTPVIQGLSRQLADFQKIPKKTPEQAYESEMLRQAVLKQLGQEFDARQDRYNEELKQLEAKVQTLKDLAGRRQEARGQIIDRRLDQLLRDAEGLGW